MRICYCKEKNNTFDCIFVENSNPILGSRLWFLVKPISSNLWKGVMIRESGEKSFHSDFCGFNRPQFHEKFYYISSKDYDKLYQLFKTSLNHDFNLRIIDRITESLFEI